MSFLNSNNSVQSPDDASSDCDYYDNVQQDLLQHFSKEIRISSGSYFQTQPLSGTSTLSKGDHFQKVVGKVLLSGNAGMKVEESCMENGTCDGKGSGREDSDSVESRKVNKARRDSDSSSAVRLNHVSSDSGNDLSASLHCDFANSSNADCTNPFDLSSHLASSLVGDEGESGTIPNVAKRPFHKHGSTSKIVRKTKEPSLNISFPSKIGNNELKIIRQPEEQHRARYLTEGSRGTVKDKSGQSHPTVKLFGCDQPVALQVFVGTDVGKLKPHGFYQACKVSNKNSTSCIEKDIEGTTVIEVMLEPKQDMTTKQPPEINTRGSPNKQKQKPYKQKPHPFIPFQVDCVGILKLRNADVEQRIGLAKSKKKSTCARLVFRVNIPKPDGTFHTLQASSTPILCTQPTGAPEISKKSIGQSITKGGDEMFIIGKNFMKGTMVVFEEVINDKLVWSKEADIDQDFFQATHLVCTIPSYHTIDIKQPVEVQIVVHSSGRTSEPVPFVYIPNVPHVAPSNNDACMPMDTESAVARSSNNSQEMTGLKRPYEPSPVTVQGNYAKSAEEECLLELSPSSGVHPSLPAAKDFIDPVSTLEPSIKQSPVDSPSVEFSHIPHPVSQTVESFLHPIEVTSATNLLLHDNTLMPGESGVAAMASLQTSVREQVGGAAMQYIESPHGNMFLPLHITDSMNGGLSNGGGVGLQQPGNRLLSPQTEQASERKQTESGEPQSKRLASDSMNPEAMNLIMQFINDGDDNGMKQTMNEPPHWNQNKETMSNSILDVRHLGSNLENAPKFDMKSFSPPNSAMTMTSADPLLFNFNGNITGTDAFLNEMNQNKQPTNFSNLGVFDERTRLDASSSPLSMDTCTEEHNHHQNSGRMPFVVQPIDDKTNLFLRQNEEHQLNLDQQQDGSLSMFQQSSQGFIDNGMGGLNSFQGFSTSEQPEMKNEFDSSKATQDFGGQSQSTEMRNHEYPNIELANLNNLIAMAEMHSLTQAHCSISSPDLGGHCSLQNNSTYVMAGSNSRVGINMDSAGNRQGEVGIVNGSMSSNLQQSLTELEGLKQQVGITGPQSPTHQIHNGQPAGDSNVIHYPANGRSCDVGDRCMNSSLQQSLTELEDLKHQIGIAGPQSPTHQIHNARELSQPASGDSNVLLHYQNGLNLMNKQPDSNNQSSWAATPSFNGQAEKVPNQTPEDFLFEMFGLSPGQPPTLHHQTPDGEPSTARLVPSDQDYSALRAEISQVSNGNLGGKPNDSNSGQVFIVLDQKLGISQMPAAQQDFCFNIMSTIMNSMPTMNNPLTSMIAGQAAGDYAASSVPMSQMPLLSLRFIDRRQLTSVGSAVSPGKVISVPAAVFDQLSIMSRTGTHNQTSTDHMSSQSRILSDGQSKQPIMSPKTMSNHALPLVTNDASYPVPQSSERASITIQYLPTVGSDSILSGSLQSNVQSVERRDQPMDTSMPPIQFSSDSNASSHVGNNDISRGNLATAKVSSPELLYHLLANNQTSSLGMTIDSSLSSTANISSLPDLSVDDVNRLLDMTTTSHPQC